MRAECTIDIQLINLLDVLEHDVKEMQNLPASLRRGHRFTFQRLNGNLTNRAFIQRYKEEQPNPNPVKLTFTQHRDKIVVEMEGQQPLKIRLSWNAQKGACELCIEQRSYDVSTISQKILGPFFFDVE